MPSSIIIFGGMLVIMLQGNLIGIHTMTNNFCLSSNKEVIASQNAIAETRKEAARIASVLTNADNELSSALTEQSSTQHAISELKDVINKAAGLAAIGAATKDDLEREKLAKKSLSDAESTLSKINAKIEALTAKRNAIGDLLDNQVKEAEALADNLPELYKQLYIERLGAVLTEYTAQAKKIINLVAEIRALQHCADISVFGNHLPLMLPALDRFGRGISEKIDGLVAEHEDLAYKVLYPSSAFVANVNSEYMRELTQQKIENLL